MYKQWRHVFLGFMTSMVLSVSAIASPPQKVVSINVCTDQLAVMLAKPGQLHSVSWLATDPHYSVVADRIDGFKLNRGQAEEIFLMKPDLVLAGTYTTQETVALLQNLGIRVELFKPETSLDDIKTNIERMASLLGNETKGRELLSSFQAELDVLRQNPLPGLTVAVYHTNSYTSGSNTLIDDVIELVGLTNLANTLGYVGIHRLPLENLVLAAPDMIVSDNQNYGYPSKAEENFTHPVFKELSKSGHGIRLESKYLGCGTPETLKAAHALVKHAQTIGGRND